MDRALAVVDGTESNGDLLREAGELAAGVGASVVVLSVMTQDGYDDELEALSQIESIERTTYNKEPEHLTAAAAERAANQHLPDVEYETRGLLVEDEGERADAIVDTAEDAGCDYVFLVGKRRSPTGKALFGDTAQSVLLNFDGRVVVTME
ncbi:universal stress protein [Natrononativus amylolyticus]|uniref:universal stress protein n=1 Tax=Natrononativus amylolyticus TaxID=2963434 RepID=UPI0020CCAA76|nr:universal stress protein [Natrononativus amylolyticus]